jgi:peptidoglycan hydrolase CwlO-like protein
MKNLWITLFIVSMLITFLGCSSLNSQSVSNESKEDLELKYVMNNMKNTFKVNSDVQSIAEKKQTEIVQKAAEQIVNLKAQVAELKNKLEDANKKIDSTNIIGSEPFKIRGASN